MPESAGVLPAIVAAPATGPGGGIESSTPRLRAGDAEDEGVALAAASAQRGGADSPAAPAQFQARVRSSRRRLCRPDGPGR
jgi:hypothetical protein